MNYSIKETAKMLNVSYSTVRNWIRKGKLKSIKIGHTVRIPERAIDEAIDKGVRNV